MDEVECIAQELQDWEGFVPFYFPGQAQSYPGCAMGWGVNPERVASSVPFTVLRPI
jgi:hypothetical protein